MGGRMVLAICQTSDFFLEHPNDHVSNKARSRKDHKADSCGLITTLLATLEMGYMHSNNLAQEAKTLPATTILFRSVHQLKKS